jgi:capsular polysaccharide biosynthesis protein
MELLRRYLLLIVLAGVGGLAGGAYDVVKTPTYTAESYVVVTAAQGDSQSALNFAQAYGRIATTGAVTTLAAQSLGSPTGLAGLTASTSPDAPVVEISATGPDPGHTADVANAVAQALVKYAGTRTDSTRVTLSVLALAAVPTAPASPKPPLEAGIGFAGGLLVGGLATLAGAGASRNKAASHAEAPARQAAGAAPVPVDVRVRRLALPGQPAQPGGVRSVPWYASQQPVPQHPAGQHPVPPHPVPPHPVPQRVARPAADDRTQVLPAVPPAKSTPSTADSTQPLPPVGPIEPTEILPPRRPATGRANPDYYREQR